ncbi:MAG: hypothetical protein M8357_06815 [Desulfobulbaceae bacterium]|nr:hypothetical protein [Desulfobulbaceae bacterium]
MPTDVDPIAGNWYCHLDKGQRFLVVAVDETGELVEVQNFDGDIDEFDLEAWYQMDIELCEAPENWSGPLDIDNVDDLGTQITDTSSSDWKAPLNEFESKIDHSEED